MKITKNETSDLIVNFKERTGYSWDKVALIVDLSKMTLYRRMKLGNWRPSEAFYIWHMLKEWFKE